MERRVEIRVRNLDCEDEAAAIARGLAGFAGVSNVKVYAKAGKVSAEIQGIERDRLEARLAELGFPPGREEHERASVWRNPKVLASLASGILLAAGWAVAHAGAPDAAVVAVYVVSMLVGGWYFGREAIEDLVRERRVGIELLMSTAAVVAALMGAPGEGAMLAFLYSISEAAEGYTEEKTRAAIRALMKLAPKTALRLRDGHEEEVPVEELTVGEVFLVKPGQSVPTDGVVLRGTSKVNQAPVTGESAPAAKEPGSTVFAATVNGNGALEVRATKSFAENTLSRIIHLVEEAQEQKGRSQTFIERFGAVYSPAVLGIGVLVALVPFAFGSDPREWLARATVFIVAAAPCALVISIPITMVATLGTGARKGVLVKGGRHLEELARIRVVAFDKTGTLTTGKPAVTEVLPVDGAELTVEDGLAVAAAVERRSAHPLARAVVTHAERMGLPRIDVADAEAIPGAGASARWRDRVVYAGNLALFERLGSVPETLRGLAVRLESEGKTVIVVGEASRPWLVLGVRDEIRPGAADAIRALREAGIERIVMLSGDNRRAATAIAGALGIDEALAELDPEAKLEAVRSLVAKHRHVAMVGDGINDAPALAQASVGIAMGAAGTDVALETADVALMADDLTRLEYAVRLARRNAAVVRQNLALSAVVIGVFVALAIGGALSLPVAVVGHELSEFVVIASGLRMLRS
jgi:heavy metal translocating P-type ATPase